MCRTGQGAVSERSMSVFYRPAVQSVVWVPVLSDCRLIVPEAPRTRVFAAASAWSGPARPVHGASPCSAPGAPGSVQSCSAGCPSSRPWLSRRRAVRLPNSGRDGRVPHRAEDSRIRARDLRTPPDPLGRGAWLPPNAAAPTRWRSGSVSASEAERR